MESVNGISRQVSRGASAFRLRARWIYLCLTLAFCMSGCRSLRPSDGEGIFASSDLLSTDRIRGPLERALYNEEDALTRGEKFSAEAMRSVQLARSQFDQKEYRQAAKTYKKIAKEYPDTSIGEEAWFRMGECYFAMNELPKAQESYDKLFKDYPSTRYVADASQRMFSIAKTWMEITDPVAKSAIKTVSEETVVAEPEPEKLRTSPSARFGLIPNFFDNSRPMFDTKGRAENALRSIWLNDPTGPLADDALMLTASWHLKKGNYLEADRYFEILREEYPDSPHLEDAFVMGSHVKQMSYQGPYYDGTTLIAAENLKQKSLTLFPNSEDRQQLRTDLNKVYLLKAQRAWADVELWKRKNNSRAVAIQAVQLINNYPETRYAEMARRELRSINPADVRDLPGVSDFIESIRSAPPNSTDGPSPVEPPVKSVSTPSDEPRPPGV